jgi:hypothetical protein
MGMPVGKMLEDVELYYDALVPAIYSPNRLPEGFILKHWSLDNETIQRSMINARIDGAETKIRP